MKKKSPKISIGQANLEGTGLFEFFPKFSRLILNLTLGQMVVEQLHSKHPESHSQRN